MLIISDSFLPEGNAAAVHMSELEEYLHELGHEVILCTSASGALDASYQAEKLIKQVPNPWKRSKKIFTTCFRRNYICFYAWFCCTVFERL